MNSRNQTHHYIRKKRGDDDDGNRENEELSYLKDHRCCNGHHDTMELTTFTALAEPSRFRIVDLLLRGPMTVGDIAERLEIRQPQASKHLKVLLEAGLVEVKADANRRNYMLRSEPFEEMDHWLNDYRRIWSERFDNLDNYLEKLQADTKNQD